MMHPKRVSFTVCTRSQKGDGSIGFWQQKIQFHEMQDNLLASEVLTSWGAMQEWHHLISTVILVIRLSH